MEDLWEHALTVLEERDISELHSFQDETGILDNHRKHFDHFKDANTKDVYFELIKMMLEQEMAEKPSTKKCRDIKEVRKIQGYQDLTNKLFRRATKTLINNYVVLKERMDKIEGLLGTGGDFVLTDKLNDLEYKIEELGRRSEAKIAEVKEENLNHNTRLGGVETEVQDIQDKLRAREELELVEAEQARIQKEVLEVLEKRIDKNEDHFDMLMQNDKKQDETLAHLEASLPNLDGKLKALESADEFFQEAHKDMAKKAQDIEDDGKKMGISLKELADALEHFKEEKEINDAKIRGKLEVLTGEDNDIRKKLEDFIEDQAKIDDKQNKDLEALENDVRIIEENLKNLQSDHVDGKEHEHAELENLKKNIDEVGEKVRQLEGISNQNADVINTFTINHITYNEKFNKLEEEAREFSGQVMNMLEDRRRECNDNAEEIKQLHERVKYNYDRLDPLSEIPLKVQNLEHANYENGSNLQNLRDMLHRLEGDINNNSEKIAIETDWREKGDDELNNKIDQLRREAEAVLARLEGVDDMNKQNLEKIIGLEEAHVTQLEKAVYVESLASRVTAIDEAKQMSEAKMKEELEDNVRGNKEAINKLFDHFTERLDELKGVNAIQTGDIGDLKAKSHQLEQEIDKVRDDSRRLVDEELDKLAARLQDKVGELDAICAKNEKHVENLRELNNKLLDDMERNQQESLNKMDEKIEAIRKEIPNIDPADFASLVDSKFQLEAKLNDLLERSKIISDELDDTKKDLEGKHAHTHTIIRETTERTDSTMQRLEEKMYVIERIQGESKDELRKEFEDLKEHTRRAEDDLEQKITQVDNQARQGIEGVGHQVEEKAKTAQRHYQGLRIDLDLNKRNLWTIFLEMYGTMRCYTVVMKSEGSAAEHQSACLGVYRSVDWCNHRPVYKQENGENYLYYNSRLKSWMVASYVGNEYAWMKYEVYDAEDDKSSSSSSSSSSSDSEDEEEKRQKKKAKKISWRGLRTPDLFNPGWQYKLSPLRMNEETIDQWMTDDQTLRVEPLGDVEKLTGLIQNVRKTKETITYKA